MTQKCKNCDRPLEANEIELCPNCQSEKHGTLKKTVEGFLAAAAVLFAFVKIMSKKS